MFEKDPSGTCVGGRWIGRGLTAFHILQGDRRWDSGSGDRDGDRYESYPRLGRISLPLQPG